MSWSVGVKAIEERLDHLDRMALAGVTRDVETPDGDTVVLWRKFRDDGWTCEVLPLTLAKWTLFAIPECEPTVERAKIVR